MPECCMITGKSYGGERRREEGPRRSRVGNEDGGARRRRGPRERADVRGAAMAQPGEYASGVTDPTCRAKERSG